MSSKNCELSTDLRKLIVKLYCEGNSMGKVANIVKKSKSTVQYTIEHYGKYGSVATRPRTDRPKIINEQHERYILRQVKKNPKTSATTICKELEKNLNLKCSAEAVRVVLRKNNYSAKTARKKPFTSKINKAKRLKYAKEYLKKDQEFWNRVIFSDESKFNIHGSDSGQKLWRKPNTELQLANLNATVKHAGGSVMVWGCMSAGGVGNLAFIDTTMDSKAYLEILKTNLLRSAEKLGLNQSFIFMQDNDPKHTS